MAAKKTGRKPKATSTEEHWGKRLKAALEENKMSQREAARFLGVSASVLDAWLRRGATPNNLKLVKKLADRLKIDFTWLLTGEFSEKKSQSSIAELFESTPYFDGYARIRIDRLVPRSGNDDQE